jgi:hypothetical protein
MNMDYDPYGEDLPEHLRPPAPASKKRKTGTRTAPRTAAPPKYCEFCGTKGHVTKKSKKCGEFGNDSAFKLYNKVDGSLLLADNDDDDDAAGWNANDFGVPVVDTADCEMQDLTPWDNES